MTSGSLTPPCTRLPTAQSIVCFWTRVMRFGTARLRSSTYCPSCKESFGRVWIRLRFVVDVAGVEIRSALEVWGFMATRRSLEIWAVRTVLLCMCMCKHAGLVRLHVWVRLDVKSGHTNGCSPRFVGYKRRTLRADSPPLHTPIIANRSKASQMSSLVRVQHRVALLFTANLNEANVYSEQK